MSGRNVLVINSGSSSIKFALVNEDKDEFILEGLAECIGSPEAEVNWKQNGEKVNLKFPNADHSEALAQILPHVQKAAGQIHAIGHRVVHGGSQVHEACLLTPDVIEIIEQNASLAPLHNPPGLMGIEAAQKLYPELPHVGVFDTAFHQSMPAHAYRYAIPEEFYSEHGIRRYGFHGTSHLYVSRKGAEMAGLPVDDSCWLVAHLGNGCSATAVVNGESRDTTMGLTPLEGLVMGTRSGDVDPSLQMHLHRTFGYSAQCVETLLTKKSGLLGVSGLSNDMRTLIEASEKGNEKAALAIEIFCYRLAKQLAGLSCALPRLDGLLFTGGIGENATLIRKKTLDHMRVFNFKLDDEANQACTRGNGGQISAEGHPLVLVVPTNEERQIANETLEVVDGK